MSENNNKNNVSGSPKPKKRRYYHNNNNKKKKETSGPKIQPKSYTHKTKQIDTFTELQYSDKVIYVLGGVTLIASIAMWFMGHREEATYIGVWVPGIFSAGTFIRFSLTRAKRR